MLTRVSRTLLPLLLVAIAAAAQSVTFNAWPNSRMRPANPTVEFLKQEIASVKAALDARLISATQYEMIVLANGHEYENVYNYGPAMPFVSNGNVKTWWNSGVAFEAVMPGRNPDGSWATEPNQDTMEGLQWATRELYEFYRLYQRHFPVVPKFVLQKIDAAEAGRAQFGNGPAVDFPLARITRNDPTANFRSSFPPGIGFRVNGQGVLEWFKLAEYRAAYPITTSINIPPPVEQSPGTTVLTIRMLVNNPELSVLELYNRIKALFVSPGVVHPQAGLVEGASTAMVALADFISAAAGPRVAEGVGK